MSHITRIRICGIVDGSPVDIVDTIYSTLRLSPRRAAEIALTRAKKGWLSIEDGCVLASYSTPDKQIGESPPPPPLNFFA